VVTVNAVSKKLTWRRRKEPNGMEKIPPKLCVGRETGAFQVEPKGGAEEGRKWDACNDRANPTTGH